MMFFLYLVLLVQSSAAQVSGPGSIAAKPVCKVDLGVILDESGSIGQNGFVKSIQFLKKLVDGFQFGTNGAQMALVELSGNLNANTMLNFNFGQFNSNAALKAKLGLLNFNGGTTPTGTALQVMRTKVYQKPTNRPGVRDVCFVLTDGKPFPQNEETKMNVQAPLLQGAGVKVLAVGVGSGIDMATLQKIASMGDPDYILQVDDFNQLDDVIDKLIAKICKVDGNWGPWTPWSACSKTCGTGQRSRSRKCNNPAPQFGGAGCVGPAAQVGFCNQGMCPIDGNWGPWGPWKSCSKSCGGGLTSRGRICDSPPPQFGGANCVGSSLQTATCNQNPCPIDGNWGNWTPWTTCQVTCGGGTRTRSRVCNNPPPQFGGADCVGSAAQGTGCNSQPCPIDGGWTPWSPWSDCSSTCGNGVHSRSRTCTSPVPQFGGQDCVGPSGQTAGCNNGNCPSPDPDPNDFCFRCKGRRNQKDYYENPANCSQYYHCFFNSNGDVTGILQECPPGMRFDEGILTCVPMINGSCDDPCNTTAVQADGFWADPGDCGTYYQCSNYHSVKNCCPKGLKWNQELKLCVAEPCDSNCLPDEPVVIPMLPPELIGENRCKDQYGVTYEINAADNTKFSVVLDNNLLIPYDCALGSFFELATCKCSGRLTDVTPLTPTMDCILNITCDPDILDHSPYHFFVDNLVDPKVTVNPVTGGVCAFAPTANLEVPGMQTMTLGDKVSIMFCVNVACSEGTTAGLLSNRGGTNNDELSVLFQVDSVGNLVVILETKGSGTISLTTNLPCGQYVHVALTYDGSVALLYINTQQVASTPGTGMIAWMKHCPLSIGHDQLAGHLTGSMDDILIYRKILASIAQIQSMGKRCLDMNGGF